MPRYFSNHFTEINSFNLPNKPPVKWLLRHREVKQLARSHTASTWQNWRVKTGSWAIENTLYPLYYARLLRLVFDRTKEGMSVNSNCGDRKEWNGNRVLQYMLA